MCKYANEGLSKLNLCGLKAQWFFIALGKRSDTQG